MAVFLLKIENFQKEVIEESNSKLVIVDFSATWCTPCKALEPVFTAIEDEMSGSAKFCKFDIDTASDSSVDSEIENPVVLYRVVSVPTVVFFKGGREVERFSGVVTKQVLQSKVLSLL